jgi:hypothetical protein
MFWRNDELLPDYAVSYQKAVWSEINLVWFSLYNYCAGDSPFIRSVLFMSCQNHVNLNNYKAYYAKDFVLRLKDEYCISIG